MPPQALQLAFFLIEEGIKLEPSIAAEIQALLSKANPTPQDWQLLRARVLAKSYESYDPTPIPTPVPITILPAAAVATAQTLPAPVSSQTPPAPSSAPPVATAPLVGPVTTPAELPITDTHTE